MLLIDLLQKKYPTAKRTTLRRMLEAGRVSLAGNIVRIAKMEVPEDVKLSVDERPREVVLQTTLDPMELVHEDPDILVINKPPGLLTSTVAKEKRPTAIAIIQAYLTEREPRARAGVIHRLDRDASGLLVFSKHNDAYEDLKSQFYKHTVERVYTAVVHGVPNPRKGTIENRLVEFPDGSVKATRVEEKGERAVTDYEVLEFDKKRKLSLVKVTLQTGRKHQIRAHLSQRGTPIVGDSVYGPEKKPKSRLLLAATLLSFDHPRTGERMAFRIQPPAEVEAIFPNAPAAK